jgi:hypothetical protein
MLIPGGETNVKHNLKPVIPPTAREVVCRRTATNGETEKTEYYVGNRLVGRRFWEPNRKLCMEYGMKDGLMHGIFRDWWPNGALAHQSHYVNGKEHGLSKQYDNQGRLIGTYRMKHGTGADLWYHAKGKLAEERYYADGMLNGFERWWWDARRVYQESHYRQNKEHGIFREWNVLGRLRRGYPKYFVSGRQVNKRAYFRACLHDDSLPKFVIAENRPYRKKPKMAQGNFRMRVK